LLTQQFVGGRPARPPWVLNHNDFFASRCCATAFKKIAEPNEGQSFASQIDDAALVRTVLLCREFETLLDGAEGMT